MPSDDDQDRLTEEREPAADGLGQAASATPILSFSPKKLRVQITFTPDHCFASALPPADMMARAQTKMQAVRAAGQVAFFVLYRKRLERAWAELREAVRTGGETPASVTVIVAAGAPALPGIELAPATSRRSLATLRLPVSRDEAAAWRTEWLLLHVRRFLRERGIKLAVNTAQVHGALARARAGLGAQSTQLTALRRQRQRPPLPFVLAVNRARGEVTVTLYNLDVVADLVSVQGRIGRIEKAMERLGHSRGRYRILKDELLEALATALAGPEQLGIGMPLTLLAAVDLSPPEAAVSPPARQPRLAKTSAAEAAPAPEPILGSVPGPEVAAEPARLAPRQAPAPALPRRAAASRAKTPPLLAEPEITFQVSPDKMTAAVADFTPVAGSGNPVSGITDEWLKARLAAAGIVHGVLASAARDLTAKVLEGGSPAGLTLAQGLQPVAAALPVLKLNRGIQVDASDTVNLRGYNRRVLAQPGQLIAEVEFGKAAEPGRTVTGEATAPLPNPTVPNLVLGEGIQADGNGRFFATAAGIVDFDGQAALSLSKALVHEGDVNLTTGDIVFDGPVEIKGSIDSGARINITGDLIIHGEVRGGTIVCGGSLTVARGIVAGPTGSLRVRGDVAADFIEGSTIICRGNLTAVRSIMQSSILAGGMIVVTSPTGLIGGGTYVCGQDLHTGALGLPNGQKTIIDAGVAPWVELSVRIREQRLEKLTKISEEDRRTLKEIFKKPAARLSRVERGLKDSLRERVARWGGILDQAQRHLDQAISGRTYNAEATIRVTGMLSTNCQIRIGGKNVLVAQELIAILVSTKPVDGSYLRPLPGAAGAPTAAA